MVGENEPGAIYFSRTVYVNSNNFCGNPNPGTFRMTLKSTHFFLINDFRRIRIGARAANSC